MKENKKNQINAFEKLIHQSNHSILFQIKGKSNHSFLPKKKNKKKMKILSQKKKCYLNITQKRFKTSERSTLMKKYEKSTDHSLDPTKPFLIR